MFIENLRHLNRRHKVAMIVVIALVIIGLIAAFAYVGTSYDGSSADNGKSGSYTTDALNQYESSLKGHLKSLKKNSDDLALIASVVTDYANLVTVQDMLFDTEGTAESIENILSYGQKYIDLAADNQNATSTDYTSVYSGMIQAYILNDQLDEARALYTDSWAKVGENSDYHNQYITMLISGSNYDEAYADISAYSEQLKSKNKQYTSAITELVNSVQWQAMYQNSAEDNGNESDSDDKNDDNENSDDEKDAE